MSKNSDKTEKIIIKFNKNLYNLKAIKSAIKEYQKLADFNLSQKGNYIQVELKNIDKEIRQIIEDEFCNYILSLMKS